MDLTTSDLNSLQTALKRAGDGAQIRIATPPDSSAGAEWSCSCPYCNARGECGTSLDHEPSCRYS